VPARPSGKGTLSEGKAFRSGKGRMRSGARREVEQSLMRSCAILNFDISLGRAAFGEIWILIWGGGATLGRNFDVNIERAVWEACSATWNLGTNLAFALGPRKTTENLDRVGRSQDLPNAC
jgi:hypothetical protein